MSVYLDFGRMIPEGRVDKKLEKICKEPNPIKTNAQLATFIELRNYQRKNQIKGFFKEIYYKLTRKI